MSAEHYNKVYDLLVSIGGAPERDRDGFILCHIDTEHPCREYRFQGVLGFGGKYWKLDNRVNCYPEDESPTRREIMDRLNAALEQLAG